MNYVVSSRPASTTEWRLNLKNTTEEGKSRKDVLSSNYFRVLGFSLTLVTLDSALPQGQEVKGP